MVIVPDFDTLYRSDPDPWQVASSFYEQRKRAVLLACLTRASYASAWDPACGTGDLAAELAHRADAVVATDSSAEAVRLTAARCAGLPQVSTGQIRQPGRPERPEASFALVVIAEFAYYLADPERARLWSVIAEESAPTAEIVVVHWRHRPHDGYLSGADANLEAIQSLTGPAAAPTATAAPAAPAAPAVRSWVRAVHHDDRDFVLDVLVRD
ncbi:MAG TPA: class I SAM-dependent methyltransferase [Microlunatus sp.]